ncbi:pyridoxamine 5'-phosphate oxidase family protein [Streptomyces sp. NBC_00104]|uniref:pyridoxamine 5'-phosphate oxidase family protein n=1 Tax=Streptomyces sp. NBC_00104 TaxID=2903621 RepID=UPI0032449BC8
MGDAADPVDGTPVHGSLVHGSPVSPVDGTSAAARPGAVPPDAAVRDRLTAEKNVWLCTVRPDGAPHVTPVWFVFLRGSWWIGADGGSVKVRNIERFARVSLALEDGGSPVVAEGTAVVRRGPFPADLADLADVTEAFAAKYGWDVTAPHRPGETRVLLEVPVRRWLLAGTAQ